MDVTLYVYDLSRGLARQLSQSLLGTYIDAVYHTALVFNNIEYFFGQGVQTCLPGTTHHGQPMEKITLGQTELPMEVILDYLESLKEVYTPESYDLFLHNCNNFSNDFSMFLVGKGIPDHITSLPQTVLRTPFGQMLKPQLDQAMRGIMQAPVAPPPQKLPATNGAGGMKGFVQKPGSFAALSPLLEQALTSCAVLFFTSATCAPCRICYGPFEALASDYQGRATFVQIDTSQAMDIAQQYGIRATPTFITLLHGEQVEQWSSADVGKLEANTRLLIQMAYPPHPHAQLKLPVLQREHKPHVYSKIPPVEKVLAKVDISVRNKPEVQELVSFIKDRSNETKAANVALPNLAKIGPLLREQILQKPPLTVFPLVDLFRLALLDVRVSGYFAEEQQQNSVLHALITHGSTMSLDAGSYPFLLTATQALSNSFTSQLSFPSIIDIPELLTIVSNGLLATTYPALRATAANLVYNIAGAHHREVMGNNHIDKETSMKNSTTIELTVSIIEALKQELSRDKESDTETIKTLLTALGLLLYGYPRDFQPELADIIQAIEAKTVIQEAKSTNGVSGIVTDVLLVLPRSAERKDLRF